MPWPSFDSLPLEQKKTYENIVSLFGNYVAPTSTSINEKSGVLSLVWMVESKAEFIDLVIYIFQNGNAQIGVLTHLNHGLKSDAQYSNLEKALSMVDFHLRGRE